MLPWTPCLKNLQSRVLLAVHLPNDRCRTLRPLSILRRRARRGLARGIASFSFPSDLFQTKVRTHPCPKRAAPIPTMLSKACLGNPPALLLLLLLLLLLQRPRVSNAAPRRARFTPCFAVPERDIPIRSDDWLFRNAASPHMEHCANKA